MQSGWTQLSCSACSRRMCRACRRSNHSASSCWLSTGMSGSSAPTPWSAPMSRVSWRWCSGAASAFHTSASLGFAPRGGHGLRSACGAAGVANTDCCHGQRGCTAIGPPPTHTLHQRQQPHPTVARNNDTLSVLQGGHGRQPFGGMSTRRSPASIRSLQVHNAHTHEGRNL